MCRSSICFCVFSPTAWRFQTHCNSCIKSATPRPALTHNQMWFISVCPDRFVFDTRQLRPVVVFVAIFKFKHYFSFSTEKKEKKQDTPKWKRPRIVEHVFQFVHRKMCHCGNLKKTKKKQSNNNNGWQRRLCVSSGEIREGKTTEVLPHGSQASMQAGAVRSAKAMVAFIPTSATGLVPLSRRGVKTVCMQPQRVAVHLTAALSLITKAGPCSKLAEVKRRQATEEHDVNYSHSSGVEKYPCEFWPALLLFCMMLCFEVKKKKIAS